MREKNKLDEGEVGTCVCARGRRREREGRKRTVVCEGENGSKARAHFVLKPKEAHIILRLHLQIGTSDYLSSLVL